MLATSRNQPPQRFWYVATRRVFQRGHLETPTFQGAEVDLAQDQAVVPEVMQLVRAV